MKFPKISVIVPIYNVSLYLAQCLDSLIHQTFSDIEILCIDDSSTDQSIQIVKSYQKMDPRIHLYQQAHQGVSAARNLGLRHASGEYVIFIDSDDWVEETMLESMLNIALHSDCDVVVCSAQVHFSTTTSLTTRQKHTLQRSMAVQSAVWTPSSKSPHVWQFLKYNGNWPFIWNKLIRKCIIDRNDIFFLPSLALGEDGVFLQILYQYVSKVVFISPKLYHYRYQRNSSATSTLAQDLSARFRHHIDVISELIRELSERRILKRNGEALLQWSLFFLYLDFLRLSADLKETASSALLELFSNYELIPLSKNLAKVYQNRLNIMLYFGKDYGKFTLFIQIIKTKIENRTICLFMENKPSYSVHTK